MLCPICKVGTIVANVTVTRAIPLAKGGGLNLQGITVTQADLRAAHENDLETVYVNRSQEREPHFPVACDNGGKEAGIDANGMPTAEVPFCAQAFWYFPSYKEGKPGRGLTLPQGKAIKSASSGDASEAAADPNEGMIPAEEIIEEAPVAAPPVALTPKPAIARRSVVRRLTPAA